jgi:hypothetical protein
MRTYGVPEILKHPVCQLVGIADAPLAISRTLFATNSVALSPAVVSWSLVHMLLKGLRIHATNRYLVGRILSA